jgi:hypothetical protein
VKAAESADLKRVAGILRSSGYQGWVMLEYEAKADPFVAVPEHLKVLRGGAGVRASGWLRVVVPMEGVRAAERPDIVVNLADDPGWSDLGCYCGAIRTLVLDGLAAGGVRFTQFYNSARCCPARASLLSGLYPHQGVKTTDRGFEVFYGMLGGYNTYWEEEPFCSRWHSMRRIFRCMRRREIL